MSSVSVSFDPLDDSEDDGCSWDELHFSAGIFVHSRFLQNIFGIRTLGKWLHFCHRSVEGPQSVASARSSSAVNSHKLISPPEIRFLLSTHLKPLVTLLELTSESETSQPQAEASCSQVSSGCC